MPLAMRDGDQAVGWEFGSELLGLSSGLTNIGHCLLADPHLGRDPALSPAQIN